jgi:Dyp-type peroxidase family
MATTPVPTIDWNDVQGIVLRGYGKHAYAANLFLQVDDAKAACAWLGTICDRITTAARAQARGDESYLNLAFTRTGLAKLGFSDAVLATFPTAFFEGMASSNRARILGDDDVSDSKNWNWGGAGKEVDAILMIFAKEPSALDLAVKAEQAAMKGISVKFDPVNTQLSKDQKEHFGFHDGISQPIIAGSPPPAHPVASPPADGSYAEANVIEAGEFLLGYPDAYGVLPDSIDMPPGSDKGGFLPTVKTTDGADAPDLGHNGTYLVVRQVAQHVPELWTYLDDATKDAAGQSCPAERDKLASKLVGRWPSGAPMAIAPEKDDPRRSAENDFLYQSTDPEGLGCPFGSHIRRGNPRDTLGDDPAEALKLTRRHRLIRRGRSYGPRPANSLDRGNTQECGLMFMCINANIERQFEFVQQTWINSPSFNGLYNERDPIFGNSSSQKTGTMTIPRQPVRRRLSGLGGFVTVRGGAYFFLPSIKALRYLAAWRSGTGSI